MIIVSETSPLNYLVLIEHQEVLLNLFGRVIVPQGVLAELQRDRTPRAVREWISGRSESLEVQRIQSPESPALDDLHLGQREAIVLAGEIRADALLIDDKEGCREAINQRLLVIGTLGVLDRAAERGLINLAEAIDLLRRTTFRGPKEIFEAMLRRDAERNSSAE